MHVPLAQIRIETRKRRVWIAHFILYSLGFVFLQFCLCVCYRYCFLLASKFFNRHMETKDRRGSEDGWINGWLTRENEKERREAMKDENKKKKRRLSWERDMWTRNLFSSTYSFIMIRFVDILVFSGKERRRNEHKRVWQGAPRHNQTGVSMQENKTWEVRMICALFSRVNSRPFEC